MVTIDEEVVSRQREATDNRNTEEVGKTRGICRLTFDAKCDTIDHMKDILYEIWEKWAASIRDGSIYDEFVNREPMLDDDGKDMLNPMYGKNHTESSRIKLSEAAKRRPPRDWVPTFAGLKHTEETKEKMRASAYARAPLSPEVKAEVSRKIREARKRQTGIKRGPYARPK